MRQLVLPFTIAALGGSLLLAAGAGIAAPEAPAAATKAPSAAPAAPAPAAGGKIAWDDMNKEQRMKFMKTEVVPKMKPLFQEFDADKFAKFGCGTCHGKDAKEKKFKMPSADVHALPGTPAAFQAAMAKNPTWPKFAKFMGEKVKPQMAALLGMPEFDPKAPKEGAFGCPACHVIEK